ncbi:hypothetical protein EDD80_11839 [Anseongella ginsenosidimutans]|uniref:Uncharacterized protein n=1 Tax=Anseongella ginsenosidimutans TaxID=496056 RepID=A0A4R3KL92_9SPHI|nr:hypothetical protein [Anseongella ginsenosidimutans]QEC51980.1 hypothetical protein FRZ59_06300 [Anseongella ginsenosidimutans]TCS84770.1 hypothetical protein EDD80_11839 [Anseongella ginsenosidimutans]
MDLKERKAFESVRKEALWFGKAFLASKGGTAWDGAKGLSGLRIAPWFDYYWGLIHGRFEECCKHLGDFRLEAYDKTMLLKEVSGLIEAVTAFDIPPPPSDTPQQKMKWERLPVTPAFVKQYQDKLDTLFDKDIIYNAPWNERNSDNSLVIISADNRFYKDHLLAVYTDLLETLNALAPPRPDPELKHKPEHLEKEVERLKNEIEALKKQQPGSPNDESAQEDQASEDGSGHNLVYRMVLLHRLGFLDKNRWPENATQEQISNVLAAILGSPQAPAKMSTIKRYLKGLVNQDYDGQKIEEKYGPRVEEFLKECYRRK